MAADQSAAIQDEKEGNYGESSRCSINDLTDDALIRIFSYLSPADRLALEIVSKRWSGILKDMWKSVKTIVWKDFHKQVVVPKSSCKCKGETEFQWVLCLKNVETVCARKLASVVRMDFRDTKLSPEEPLQYRDILRMVSAQELPNLRQLDFENVSALHEEFAGGFIDVNEGILASLEYLNISGCIHGDEQQRNANVESAVAFWFSHCHKLRELKMSEVHATGFCLAELPETLEKFTIDDNSPRSFPGFVDVCQLKAMHFFGGGACERPKLKELRLYKGVVEFEGLSVSSILSTAPNLTILDLSHINGLQSFKDIGGFQHLTELYLNRMELAMEDVAVIQSEDVDPDQLRPDQLTHPSFLYMLARSPLKNSLKILYLNGLSMFYQTPDQNLEEIGRFKFLEVRSQF